MTESPRPKPNPGRTTKSQLSPALLVLGTALDTTWRAFTPPIAGTFIGIGCDHLLHSAPVATIICLILGTIASGLLIWKQLRDVQRPL